MKSDMATFLALAISSAVKACMLSACTTTTLVYEDEGVACLSPSSQSSDIESSYEEGEPLRASVFVPECFSSNCHEIQEMACDVMVGAGKVTIRSRVVVDTFQKVVCKDDCSSPLVRCADEVALVAGTYEVVFGDVTTELEIPSQREALCITRE